VTVKVDRASAELEVVASDIVRVNAERKRLYERRRALFIRLLDSGVPQAHVARIAGVTAMQVVFAVNGNPPRSKVRKNGDTPDGP